MKIILLITTLFITLSCNKKPIEDPAKTVMNPAAATSGFMPENDQCICTKEFKPVCGSDKRTYPSSCQAGCAGIKETTLGPCKTEK